MESALQLSLEQEFNLNAFSQQIEMLASEEKDKYLLELFRQLMIKNNVIRHLIVNSSDKPALL